MSDTKRCPQCQAEIPAAAPEGLCPQCLLQAGLQSKTAEAEVKTAPFSPSGARFEPPTPQALQPAFPQLEILELLGKGGMGAVYKARQPGLDRLVAVKILPPEVSDDPAFAERFTREARALAMLNHPNIVGVYDSGRAGGYYYFVMEYLDGVNLRQAMRAGELKSAEALKIVPQICEALQFAHDEGIVHRDIKPENILLDKKGRVKIADFGLAKLLGRTAADVSLTGTQQVMGTMHYMAPEQFEGSREVDHRADIYSLGVTFYEMLTGELPIGRFAAPSKKVQIDVRLDEVVLRSLEKAPEQRYQHASEIKTDMDAIAEEPAEATADTDESPVAELPAPRRPRLFQILGALTVFGGIFGIFVLTADLLLPAEIPAWLAENERLHAAYDTYTIVSMVLAYLTAIVCIPCGIGLILRQPWARRLAIGLYLLDASLMVAVIAPIQFAFEFHAIPADGVPGPDGVLHLNAHAGRVRDLIMLSTAKAAGQLLLSLAIVWYLTRPHVRKLFGEGDSPASPPTGGVAGPEQRYQQASEIKSDMPTIASGPVAASAEVSADSPEDAEQAYAKFSYSKMLMVEWYRNETGIDFKDAIAAVEPMTELEQAVLRSHSISLAVKVYREKTGADEKEATAAVEAIAQKYGIHLEPTPTPLSKGAARIALILFVACVGMGIFMGIFGGVLYKYALSFIVVIGLPIIGAHLFAAIAIFHEWWVRPSAFLTKLWRTSLLIVGALSMFIFLKPLARLGAGLHGADEISVGTWPWLSFSNSDVEPDFQLFASWSLLAFPVGWLAFWAYRQSFAGAVGASNESATTDDHTGPPPRADDPLEQLVIDQWYPGRKIAAIVAYREKTGADLAEAKAAVEKIAEKYRLPGRKTKVKLGYVLIMIGVGVLLTLILFSPLVYAAGVAAVISIQLLLFGVGATAGTLAFAAVWKEWWQSPSPFVWKVIRSGLLLVSLLCLWCCLSSSTTSFNNETLRFEIGSPTPWLRFWPVPGEGFNIYPVSWPTLLFAIAWLAFWAYRQSFAEAKQDLAKGPERHDQQAGEIKKHTEGFVGSIAPLSTTRRALLAFLGVGWTALCVLAYGVLWRPVGPDPVPEKTWEAIIDNHLWPYHAVMESKVSLEPTTPLYQRLVIREDVELDRLGYQGGVANINGPRRTELTKLAYTLEVDPIRGKKQRLEVNALNDMSWHFTMDDGTERKGSPLTAGVVSEWLYRAQNGTDVPDVDRVIDTHARAAFDIIGRAADRDVTSRPNLAHVDATGRRYGYVVGIRLYKNGLDYVLSTHTEKLKARNEPPPYREWEAPAEQTTWRTEVPILYVGVPVMLAIWGVGLWLLLRRRRSAVEHSPMPG